MFLLRLTTLAGSADLFCRSAAFCCQLGTNHPDAWGRWARSRPLHRLDGLVVDFPAVAHQPYRQHFLLSVGLVNDPVITYAQLE